MFCSQTIGVILEGLVAEEAGKQELLRSHSNGAFLTLDGCQNLHLRMTWKFSKHQYEPRHVISNNVAFRQVQTQTSLCSILLSLETPSAVRSVA